MSNSLLVRQIIAVVVILFVAWGFIPNNANKLDVNWENSTGKPQ